ncbi:ACO11 desaturase, partial [Acromyrmex insinuator]
MYIISNIGVSGGAHRLWAHKSYKAKLPLRILLLICFSAGVQLHFCRYFLLLQLFFGFILPTLLPVYLWNETWNRAIVSQMFIRYMITLNAVWSINSIAHVWGTKPYDKNIKPSDNDFINFLTIGEGYHNFHHVFPWDYRSSEKGNNRFNYTTFFIDICAKLGQAYDLKYPSENLIKSIVLNNGDGTHPILSEVPIPESD